jgi:hypothetical protein
MLLKSISRICIILFLFLSLIYAYAYFSTQGIRVDISKYSGDGKISQTGSGFLAKGFEIELSQFSLLEPFKSEFIIKETPEIKRSYIFFIRIFSESVEVIDWLHDSQIMLSVRDKYGNTLFDINAPLTEWTKTSFNMGKTDDYYYFKRELISEIDTDNIEDGPFRINFSYRPNSIPNHDGFVNINGGILLRSGGTK